MALVLVIIAFALAWLAIVALAHWMAAHLAISVLLVVLGVAGVAAFFRGLTHRAVVSTAELPPPKKRPELPAPAKPQPVLERPGRNDPWTADGPAWAEIVEREEREELLRQGPREARIIAQPCEGPGCGQALDGNPWVIEVGTDNETEEHSFCSRECLDGWHHHDLETRAVT